MSFSGRNFLLAAVIVALPVAAEAATVTHTSNLSSGQFINEASILRPGGQIRYKYIAQEAFTIASFALSATGNFAGADIAEATFGFTSPGTKHYTTVTQVGSAAFGGGFLPGLTVKAGDIFSIFFSDGISHPITVGLSFKTTAVSAVPLPASWALLGGTVLVGGAFSLRKRKSSQSGDLAL